ncbi:unnamed protein product [Ixodes persulcatus]
MVHGSRPRLVCLPCPQKWSPDVPDDVVYRRRTFACHDPGRGGCNSQSMEAEADARWDAATTATLAFFAGISTTSCQGCDIRQHTREAPVMQFCIVRCMGGIRR